jgi:hypothetical protein
MGKARGGDMKLNVGDSVKFNISGRSYEGVIIKISFNDGEPRYTVKTNTSRFGVKDIFYVLPCEIERGE